jgi:GAF domain-containing protein
MAYQPMLRLDPSEQRGSEPPDPLEPEKDDLHAGLYLAYLARILAVRGGGASSIDLALDLVLNEIVQQACLATTATGAAIALLRGEAMVCRATSGTTAPDLGARLDMRSGLSGACVGSWQVQRCSDTETDSRVDSAVSRTLGVRSVLVVPVLDGGALIGVFEIFSPRVNAFGEREMQILQALSRRIVHTVRRAAERASPAPAAESFFASAAPDEDAPPNPPAEILPAAAALAQSPARDRWTTLLNAIVIALALLLGWMVGRVGWQHAAGGATGIATRAAKPQTAQPTALDNLLIDAGVASPLNQVKPKDSGDPQVWVDIRKGLYYCSGDRHYGKTKDGQFTTLHDARISQYQPASAVPCRSGQQPASRSMKQSQHGPKPIE